MSFAPIPVAADGPYALPGDVRLALSPDGDQTDTSTAASLDDITLTAVIADATVEVEARLSGRYTTPFLTPIPAAVQMIVVAISAYLATMIYRRGAPILPTDPIYLRWLRAQALLKDLSTGNAVIDIAGSEPPSTQAVVVNQYDGNLFNMCDFGIGYTNPFGIGYSEFN